LILDEVDLYLSQKRNDFQSLAYIISRSLPGTSLILISNKFWVPHNLQELDQRVVDTFTRKLSTIAFNEYSIAELYGILADRAKIGLCENSYDEDILEYISEISFDRGLRARGVIDITREAALLSEREGKDKIDFSHINKASDISYEQELKKIIKTLDPPAIIVLGLLLNKGGSGVEKELFEEFKEKAKNSFNDSISRATFYNVLSRLKGMEIIRSEIKGRGKNRRAILHVNEEYSSIAEAGIKEAIEEIKSSKTPPKTPPVKT
jgi:Cdc6-like AAA superfamily ATPase